MGMVFYSRKGHHNNTLVEFIPPPYLNIVKLGFTRFALKHRLWVLVKTAALMRRFIHVPAIYVLRRDKKNVTSFIWKLSVFTVLNIREKSPCKTDPLKPVLI